DALSDPAVTLAAHVWKKDLPETWSILSRAIQNEELSQYLPLSEFQDFIQLLAPVQSTTTDPQPFHLDPQIDILQQYQNHLEQITEREKNKPLQPEPRHDTWLNWVFFFILIIVHWNLWKDTPLANEFPILYFLPSVLISLLITV